MNKGHNYAFYGSLRKDQYNNTGEKSGMKYLKPQLYPGLSYTV